MFKFLAKALGFKEQSTAIYDLSVINAHREMLIKQSIKMQCENAKYDRHMDKGYDWSFSSSK